MPICGALEEKGVIIPPTRLMRDLGVDAQALAPLRQRVADPNPTWGDLVAQISANRTGSRRLAELIEMLGAVPTNTPWQR